MIKKLLFAVVLILSAILTARAQPLNDECTGAIQLPNIANYCSSVGQFSNAGATSSAFGPATCFGAATQGDVWFSFVAQATDVTITVRGNTATSAGGTLTNPQVALYLGTCAGTINQLECQSAPPGTNVAEAYQGGLFVGSTYLIRIQGAGGAQGTFQLCVNNYNAPQEPQSDCPDASILCDKSPFVVQSVSGFGFDGSELDDATCFFNGAPVGNETNSTWFVWTCDQSGTLEFTLTPLNAPDDLDFVVYRLPNGIGNCAGKEVVRCMASGDFQFPSPCMGPTGLRPGDTDISEDAGCSDPGDNAWLSPMNMVAGESYALVVNNFSATGNGFSIEFGGSGTFLGPTAQFTTLPPAVCLGTPVQVVDASVFPLGQITQWRWSFGADAQPQTATGPGPHVVQFNTPGTLPVVLTVETDLGCKVTDIQNVIVFPDVKVDTVIATPDCNGGTNGTIEIVNIREGTPAYLFSWEGGPFTPENSLDSLPVGIYNLVIRDANNCETEINVEVKEKELTVAPDITPPLCTGQDNGVVALTVTNGTPTFLFDWQDGNGFVPVNTLGGFSAGTYTILGLDGELCKGTYVVTIPDNPPVTLSMDTVHVTCFSAANGMAFANTGGGVGGFTYQWSDGQTEQEATSLAPGQYDVTASDANGCSITGGVFIVEPPDLVIDLLGTTDLLCNGIPTGSIEVAGAGGVPPYAFSSDGINFFPIGQLTDLPAGDYQALIRDANGCTDSVFASILQPLPLVVDAQPADTTVNLGFTVRTQTLTLPFGRPVTFQWTPPLGLSDPTDNEPLITAIQTQAYVVQVTDETGCTATDTVVVRVNLERPVYIPNVFYPNGALYPNDHFTVFSGPAAQSIELVQVYDRWGELIFEGADLPLNEPNLGWDGTYKGEPVFGVFTYVARVRFVDGVAQDYSGDVTVVP